MKNNAMVKITRKEFIDILSSHKTFLAGSVFRWNDEKCISALDRISKNPPVEKIRTVTEKHSNYIVFSGGSRLYFDADGEKLYFVYENEHGFKFAIQRIEAYDRFDEKPYFDYVVYEIV